MASEVINMSTWKAKYLTDTYGGNKKPIYISNGVPTILGSVASDTQLMYLSEGILTASQADVGAGDQLIYQKKGVLTASAKTVGTEFKPVWLSDGVLTPISAVGSNTQPIYSRNGVLTGLTYTQNRLYYSESNVSFAATSHYASTSKIAINSTSEPEGVNLYVNGAVSFNGGLAIKGDFLPQADKRYTLGSPEIPATENSELIPAVRWKALYVGNADSYGDYGLPIRWVDGVPQAVYPISYAQWTLDANATYVDIVSAGKIFNDTYVLQIVVTSGEAYLNSPISWNTDTANTLRLSVDPAVTGSVRGYVLLARGVRI